MTKPVNRCQGCDKVIPFALPNSLAERKWCNETCRKNTLYGGKCERCGGHTSYKTGYCATLCQKCVRNKKVILPPSYGYKRGDGGFSISLSDW